MARTEARLEPVTMEGVTIVLRNFEGRPSQFNKPGTRNFGVLLDPETAEAMMNDGWNIKHFKPREEDEVEDDTVPPQAWLPVEAAYDKGRPPRIIMLTETERKNLNEHTVELLDGVDIKNVDIIVNPSRWELNGRSGVKAYLQTMYITIEEDELDRKYAQRPDDVE